MQLLNRRALTYVLAHPLGFLLQTLKGFRANQGLLLAGAVAYYSLLSIVPLLMLAVVALSQVIDPAELLATVGRYLEWLVPGQSKAIVAEVAHFLDHRDVIGWVLLVTMLFFSSLAFTVLENAMCVIFKHRVAIRRRRYLVSAVLPYCYILALCVGMLLVTLVAGSLQVRAGPGAAVRSGLVAARRVGRAAVPAGTGRRNPRAQFHLSGDAGRAPVAVARADRRRDGGAAVGSRAACAGLV